MNALNFKIGEKVSVIDTTITGNIIAMTKVLITLEDEHGFTHQYFPNELVKKFTLTENDIDQKEILLKDILVKPKIKPKLDTLEVDLHIHQITTSNKYLSNYQMLSKQIDHAELQLKHAIKNNISKIVFIHGIGQGVLKKELYKLFKNYKVSINDANYKKYGLGATEIYIYRN